ncbi:MAG: hypothetical protein V4659_03125 [Pseudomonadota bacterium]
MPRFVFPLAALLLALLPGAGTARADYEIAQLVIQQQVVVRVPRLSVSATLIAAKPVTWVEQKGPKCIALAQLAGALITQADAVDLVSVGGGRVRARLDDDCPALDFYSGFYLKPTKDGRICAGRDAVRSRAGRKCEIDKFRTLVAQR